MVGRNVIHTAFGSGIIIGLSENMIQIDFHGNIRNFIYPDSFEKYLSSSDPAVMAQVQQDLQIRRDVQKKPVPSAVQPVVAQPDRKKKREKTERTSVAFKCNFCDGGQSAGHTGFYGVCSDSLIRYNIEEEQHQWCTYEHAPCRQYWDGQISRTELESIMQDGKDIVCYECRMLLDWKAYAGVHLSGARKGTPMRLRNVQHNSLAVLTTREPGDSGEAERFIFAVFLISGLYEGDDQFSGCVSAESGWRIELTPEQAHKIRFWNYYINQKKPDKLSWGSGLHRYLSDEQAVQILQDIAEVKRGTEEEEFARQFLDHFCTMNGIDADDVPPPGGALA